MSDQTTPMTMIQALRSAMDVMLERVTGIAASVGLNYDYDSIKQTNMIKAHELLHLAKSHDKQIVMKERLLKAYFEEGKHVGKIENLADLAAEVGLDRAEVVEALTNETYLPAVKADMAQAQAYGISGVPFYVIDGKFGISGAQDPSTFAAALTEASQA